MPASPSDLATRASNGVRPLPTTVSGIRNTGGTTLTCAALTGWSTGSAVHFVTYKIDVNGNKVAGSQVDWKGTVSGTTITNLVVRGGTDAGNSIGDIVEAAPTAGYADDMYLAITQDHDTQGRHVQLTDTNGKKIVGLTPAGSSAVNDVVFGNANTGSAPSVGSEGTDTDVGLDLTPKGKGNLRVRGRNDGWNDLSLFGSFTYSANNGQKEYVANTPVDLSSFLQAGHRISFARTVTPPTQCMAFTAASSQYATKASPTGITFTGPFTTESWVNLNSYPATGGAYIVDRFDNVGGNGWYFRIEPTGQITVGYASANSFTEWKTFQSVPLKRWVHLAAVVSSVASKTLQGIYLNGASLPVTQSSNAATTLTQATANLSVGATNAGVANTFLDGSLSEVRVWSVAQSAASILSNMAISLTGSESNLVALYQGNGVFTDKTANANTLTATGGAIATQVANPYNASEYGIITKVTSTQLTIFMGTDYNLPSSGGLSSPAYSDRRAPMGFPGSRGKWLIDSLLRTGTGGNQTSPVAGTWYNNSQYQILLPTGEWDTSYRMTVYNDRSAASANEIFSTLSTANNSESDPDTTATQWANNVTGIQATLTLPSRIIALAAAATYFMNVKTGQTTTVNLQVGNTPCRIQAVSAYL